jgi:HAE1 family hydrophobic/amphiphilic exporter-1
MTALIGLFGLLPLVISPGAGSELYRGLGSVLLGGLLTSTVFTLVLVPTLFSLAMDARHGLARLLLGTADATRHGAEPQHVAPVPQRAAARVPHSVQ